MTVVFVNASNFSPVIEKKIVRKMYCDPSHGWLAVKVAELESLGLMDKITPFSYVKGGTAYLEEDVDMMTYLNLMEAEGYHITVVQTVSDKKSIIRYYDKFPSKMTIQTEDVQNVVDEVSPDVVEYIDSEMLEAA
jgi:hypothetical protein